MRILLMIVWDEHRFDLMGCAGHELIRTPHRDAPVDRSVEFTIAYTPLPICIPVRSAAANQCLGKGRLLASYLFTRVIF